MIRRPPRSTLFPTRRSSDLHRQRVLVVRDADHLLRELLVESVQGEEGAAEPLGGQRTRVVAPRAGTPRQLGDGPDRVPRAVRVQLARGAGGLPAAVPEAAHRPWAGARAGRGPLTRKGVDPMAHATATVDMMHPPAP